MSSFIRAVFEKKAPRGASASYNSRLKGVVVEEFLLSLESVGFAFVSVNVMEEFCDDDGFWKASGTSRAEVEADTVLRTDRGELVFVSRSELDFHYGHVVHLVSRERLLYGQQRFVGRVVGSATTFSREFEAVERLSSSPLHEAVVTGVCAAGPGGAGEENATEGGGRRVVECATTVSGEVEAVEERLSSSPLRSSSPLNTEQEAVVREVLRREDLFEPHVTLVQGPPGTGKSVTMVETIRRLLRAGVKRVLVCAPSNAAVDEVMKKYVHTVNDEVTRVGQSSDQLSRDSVIEKLTWEKQLVFGVEYAVEAKEQTRAAWVADPGSRELRKKYVRAARRLDYLKAEKRKQVAERARVVFCTLSMSGSRTLSENFPYLPVVIIDEACQATEPSTLVPLQHGCRNLVLVGDPKQLPAFSRAGQSTSLFERMQHKGTPVMLLRQQYRMHQEIVSFPSRAFYGGELLTVGGRRSGAKKQKCPPYALLQVDGEEEKRGCSYRNKDEAVQVIRLIQRLRRKGQQGKVGVITFYREQVRKLQEMVEEARLDSVQVETVDSFQGRELDVVVISCVRSGARVGFLSDMRRLNVALTRAKDVLYVVGNLERLAAACAGWRTLVADAKERNLCFHGLDALYPPATLQPPKKRKRGEIDLDTLLYDIETTAPKLVRVFR